MSFIVEDTSTYRRRDLFLTRLYYFAMYGGAGFIFPFMNLFFERRGLSGQQTGWIVAFTSLTALIAAPLWTNWSAQSRSPRSILTAALILSGLAAYWLSQQSLFLWISVVACLRVLVNAGIFPLSDSLALKVTGATQSGFGSVRMWGSAGWAVVVVFSGYLIEKTDITSGFIGYMISYFLCAAVLAGIHEPKLPRYSHSAPQTSINTFARSILKSPGLLGLAVMLLITGISNNGVVQFENVFLDHLGAPESLIGIASMVSAAVEIPGMLWADRMVRRYGARGILLFSLALNGLLRLLVLLSPTISMIIFQRALGGIAFSFYTVSLLINISGNTSPQETPTALAFFTVTLASLIGMVATPLSGLAFDLAGGQWLYLISAVGYGVSWLVLRANDSNSGHKESADD